MPLKFCANLSFMFQETSNLLERYGLAKEVGFKAVESGYPYAYELDKLVEAKNNAKIEQILINAYVGDIMKGDLGFAAIPGSEPAFKSSLEKAIKYAKALNCSLIHVMSGKVEEPGDAHASVYYKNIKYAASIFEKENIIGLIEPINPYTIPNYFMNSFEKGLDVVKKVNSPNMKLMLDVFHMQQICGNLTRNITQLMPFVGHIQIAQVPDRHEPNTSGEIDYKYILSLPEEMGYNGWIGLEYKPKGATKDGLNWIKEFNMAL
ncbi:hypothetical protein L9F63_011713 [Diploptera punctata]|uniref:Putative hydroxypyruvate isomerase n=1 Tax=Diploptera punctata TaxID=6984 RepID=A0AAD8EPN0_DIPPU|nr:hypothetical protein L9F63_011713 [Diploptera punctata]